MSESATLWDSPSGQEGPAFLGLSVTGKRFGAIPPIGKTGISSKSCSISCRKRLPGGGENIQGGVVFLWAALSSSHFKIPGLAGKYYFSPYHVFNIRSCK